MTTNEQPITATELLQQWQKMVENRKEEFERMTWWGRTLGIEEQLDLVRTDTLATMWFVDKTLKLLAAQENTTLSNPGMVPPVASPTSCSAGASGV